MAEFQEVIMQAGRMCNSFPSCYECPLLDKHERDCRYKRCVNKMLLNPTDTANIENIIMTWAKKNPVPRYPTYREHVLSVFPAMNTIYVFGRCVCDLFGSNARPSRCDGAGQHDITCTACWEREIAAKIAKELGLSKEQHMEDK